MDVVIDCSDCGVTALAANAGNITEELSGNAPFTAATPLGHPPGGLKNQAARS
jgi:hypothetical protein